MAEPEQEPPASWSVGLIDDEEDYRLSARGIIEEEPRVRSLRLWSSAEEFWSDPAASELDILYIDYQLPHMNGVELVRMVRAKLPDLPLVMLTSAASDRVIMSALEAGAVGYILKMELEDLNKTTEQILSGGAVMSPSIALKVLQSFRKPVPDEAAQLTTRERQALELLATGASHARVGSAMGISAGTVKVQVA